MEHYPPNSRRVQGKPETSAAPATAEKPKDKITPVVEGRVTRRPPSLGKRIKSAIFGGENGAGVFNYVVQDVLIPAAKDMFTDAVVGAVETAFYGEPRRRSSGPRGQATSSYTQYNRMSSSAGPLNQREDPRRQDPRREMSSQARATHNFDEVILATKAEADNVLDMMYELLSNFQVVSVADLYQLLNVTPDFTDNNWGWTNLAGTSITRLRNGSGFLLDLPRPSVL